jgi:hypothetical protein
MTKAKVTIEFEFSLPDGLTQDDVQRCVFWHLDTHTDGRYPFNVEHLEYAGIDIVHEAVRCAALAMFRKVCGEEYRIETGEDGRNIAWHYKADELTDDLLKSSPLCIQLCRKE